MVPIVAALSLASAIGWVHAATDASWPTAAARDRVAASATANGNSLDKVLKERGKIPPSEQKAAAKRAKAKGMKPGAAGLAGAAAPLPGTEGPGGVPHYFGPYANWAYSPMPQGGIASIAVVDGGTGYTSPVVTVTDLYGTSTNASASALVDASGAITAINIDAAGTGYTAPIVTITDSTGTGAIATAAIGGPFAGGLKKFVDKMAGLGSGGANALGQYIPVAVADTTTYPGSDYYEIAVVEYSEKMHSALPPTKMRGYVQVATSVVGGAVTLPGVAGTFVDTPHFLGPAIVAAANRPVRVKFYNLLPNGSAGDLFIPVDQTVAGAGEGPAGGMYTQNRATLHLHGNNTVWISDGTPHQWTAPAGETTTYAKGAATQDVPDMPAAGPGQMTFFWTNAMSARLMFYHDHAMGITRLNVYAGQAAGYVITDAVDQDMINGTNVSGVNPGLLKVLPDIGVPLVIQDRTFVDADTIFAQDPTWNWGTGARVAGKITEAKTGDLWVPHVYMSAQNPWDLSGTNAFGRWHYGPWFWPPTPTCPPQGAAGCVEFGPVPNEYYDPINAPWEPPMRPGTPNPSIAGEAFNDTPVVNGTVYPYMEVDPKAYRFRILNAANDRMMNLQLYVAADNTTPTTAGSAGTVLCDGVSGALVENCTEVKMVPVGGFPNQLADWPSGVPDPATKGPDWIQIGTEGGFLPAPVVIPSQPIGWNLNPTTFNYGNVNQHSLLLGTAERADVVVDFSAYAGKTLILYNDAPAAFPAGVPSYDYFTGVPDQTETGGAPTTQPGYGPNTRTIMQIRVAATAPAPAYSVASLNAVFAKTAAKSGVFEVSQDPIIVPQRAYSSAYNNPAFPSTAVGQYVSFVDAAKTFVPIDSTGALKTPAVTLPLEPKAMHDEMGGVYDTMFGRMSGMLGLTDPTPASTAAPFLAYGYASPPTDLIAGTEAKLLNALPDGTQIWKITHNGVDTHTIHTHLFTAQLINRVAMDGIMLPPDANELGWKDTFRINPLEHTVIAMRPVVPSTSQVPFDVPNSVRLIDPTVPEGAPLFAPPPAGWFDPDGNTIAEILNHKVNFGWEYVWHCHILAHEEMDMMHSLSFAVPPKAPSGLGAVLSGSGNKKAAVLNWADNSLNETGFRIDRATNDQFTGALATFNVGPNVNTYTDTIGNTSQTYYYRVLGVNTVGDTTVYAGSPNGFPKKTVVSAVSNTAGVNLPPVAPSAVLATAVRYNTTNDRVTVTWTDNSNNETNFRIQRATDANFTVGLTTSTVNANVTSFTTGNLPRNATFYFRVQAYNASGVSSYVNATPSPVITP